jgi:hypothetical protein
MPRGARARHDVASQVRRPDAWKALHGVAVTADTRNDFDGIVVTNDFDVALAVEHRLENRCAVARENEDHSGIGLQFGCQLRGLCPNVLAFALDRFDRRLGRSNCFFGAVFVFKNGRMLVVGGIEFIKAGQFGVSQRSRLGWKANEAFDEIVTGIGVKRRLDPGKTLLCCERLGAFSISSEASASSKRDIDPGLAVIVVEEFAFDPATCSDIGVAPDKTGPSIAAANRAGEHHAPDAVGAGRIIARRRLLIDASLNFLVGGRAEGFGEIESDFASRQCIEDDGREGRETQTAFDEADRQPEAARDIFRRGTSINKGSERLRFVGRVHREAVEVFGQARFDCDFRIVLKHEAGNLVALRQDFLFGKRQQGAPAALSGFDLEFATSRRPNDEVLQQPMGCNARFQFGIRAGSP